MLALPVWFVACYHVLIVCVCGIVWLGSRFEGRRLLVWTYCEDDHLSRGYEGLQSGRARL